MKSPYQIAKDLKVSPQAVYQKIERMQEQLNPHIQHKGNKTLIDEQGESLIKSTFQNVVEQVTKQVIEQDLLKQLNNQLNTENEYLREQNRLLQEQLTKEREHGREQADKLSDLAAQLAELSRNNQILLRAEQNRTIPALMNGDTSQLNQEPQKKKSFLSRIFNREEP